MHYLQVEVGAHPPLRVRQTDAIDAMVTLIADGVHAAALSVLVTPHKRSGQQEEWLRAELSAGQTLVLRAGSSNAGEVEAMPPGARTKEELGHVAQPSVKRFTISGATDVPIAAQVGRHEQLQLVVFWRTREKTVRIQADSLTGDSSGFTTGTQWLCASTPFDLTLVVHCL